VLLAMLEAGITASRRHRPSRAAAVSECADCGWARLHGEVVGRAVPLDRPRRQHHLAVGPPVKDAQLLSRPAQWRRRPFRSAVRINGTAPVGLTLQRLVRIRLVTLAASIPRTEP